MEKPQFVDINREVVQRCMTGDRKAQYELYKLYAKAMFNICMRITNDFAESEDILQESFLNAFSHIHSFKGDATFGAWLKKIVVNNAINQVKKRKFEKVSFDNLGEDFDLEEESRDLDINALEINKIRKAIQKLPEGFRIIFSLYVLEGYDHSEIAGILNITESTSKSQFSRAKKKLKEMLTGEDHER